MLNKILVVDDNDADLLYARIVLSAAAVATEVLVFETGQDALDHLAGADGDDCDLILLDINMPEMDGFEFLQRYGPRYEAGRSRAVVVMLTSSPHPADRARAQGFGCVKGYIVKPLDTQAGARLLSLVAGIDKP